MWYVLGVICSFSAGAMVLFLGKRYGTQMEPLAFIFALIAVAGLVPVLQWVFLGILTVAVAWVFIYAATMAYLDDESISYYLKRML